MRERGGVRRKRVKLPWLFVLVRRRLWEALRAPRPGAVPSCLRALQGHRRGVTPPCSRRCRLQHRWPRGRERREDARQLPLPSLPSPVPAAPWSASSSHKGACGGRAARACESQRRRRRELGLLLLRPEDRGGLGAGGGKGRGVRAASLAAARAGAKGRRRSGRARRLRPVGIGARVWRRRMRRGFGRGESTGLGRHGSGSGWFAPGGQQRPSPCAVRLHQDTGKISNG